MIKKVLILMLLLFIVGCNYTIVESSNPIFFNDSGNNITNYKSCHTGMKLSCDARYTCKGVKINTIICENGDCMCD